MLRALGLFRQQMELHMMSAVYKNREVTCKGRYLRKRAGFAKLVFVNGRRLRVTGGPLKE